MPLLHSRIRDMLSELNLNMLIIRKTSVNKTFTNKKASPMGTTIHCEPGKHPEWIVPIRPRGKTHGQIR